MANRTRDLGDGVYRMRIDSECGLVVNVFVVRSEDRVALVDTGFPHTVAQLAEGLAEIALDLGDVTDVLYTHTHVDHMGGGAALAERWSPDEWVWEGTEPAFGDWYTYIEGIRTTAQWPLGFLSEEYARHPLVAEIRSKPRPPIRVTSGGRLRGPRGVRFGERVRIGALEFECVDGRGHDPYHCAWYERERGWLLSGDVVLALPTPLVAGMGDDAEVWLETLDRWERDLSVSWLLPGHGMPTRLFGPSVARSRAGLLRLYSELERQLATGSPVDPVEVMRGVLPQDGSRYAARSAVMLATVETLLGTLSSRGMVTRAGADRWALRAPGQPLPELAGGFGAGARGGEARKIGPIG